MNEAKGKIQTYVNKYKAVLEKQIIPKIFGTYMQRPEEKKILEGCKNLIKLIEKSQKGEYLVEEEYMSLFKALIDQEGIHFPMNILKDFKPEDVKVYSYMRLIGHLDEALLSTYYKNDDYLRSKKQQFENQSKQQHLNFIKKFN